MAALTESGFTDITVKVIDYMEGGYFHPLMMKDGRLKYSKELATSGETMFGVDRKNGTSLAKSPYWSQFWGIIDKAGAASKWKWNYRGGELEPQLRELAAKIMYPHFTALFNKYLSAKAKEIIANNIYLMFHFAYASWNGSGWFQRFANIFNNYVATKTADEINPYDVIKVRTDSTNNLIRKQGLNMKNNAFPNLVQKKKFLSPYWFDFAAWARNSSNRLQLSAD